MSHAMHRVEHVEVVGPYTLALRFDDGTERQVDLEPILEGELFGPLRDPELFRAVEIDVDFGTIQWPTGADFDPDRITLTSLYWGRVTQEWSIPRGGEARWTKDEETRAFTVSEADFDRLRDIFRPYEGVRFE